MSPDVPGRGGEIHTFNNPFTALKTTITQNITLKMKRTDIPT